MEWKNHPISWESLHKDARSLSRALLAEQPFSYILAITRGGLVPAAIVARELNIRHIDTFCVRSYVQERTRDSSVEVVKKSALKDSEELLILDDLVDTGRTAGLVRRAFPKAYFATLYAKPKGRPFVNRFVREFRQDEWVCFPWDSDLRPVSPLVEQNEGKTRLAVGAS